MQAVILIDIILFNRLYQCQRVCLREGGAGEEALYPKFYFIFVTFELNFLIGLQIAHF